MAAFLGMRMLNQLLIPSDQVYRFQPDKPQGFGLLGRQPGQKLIDVNPVLFGSGIRSPVAHPVVERHVPPVVSFRPSGLSHDIAALDFRHLVEQSADLGAGRELLTATEEVQEHLLKSVVHGGAQRPFQVQPEEVVNFISIAVQESLEGGLVTGLPILLLKSWSSQGWSPDSGFLRETATGCRREW